MRDYIYFNNKNLDEFDTYATNAGVYSAPARNYESIPVAGRNGNLIFESKSLENIEHSYPVIVMSDFDKNYAALKAYLLSQKGYKRLSDTFYPDEFYLATFSRFDSVKQKFLHGTMGTCILIFERKPQRYLKSGEKVITLLSNSTIKNPCQFDALPRVRVHGSGTLNIGDTSVTINTQSEYLDIDCELQEVLQAGGNLDVTLTNGEFPKLTPGNNTISFTGISKVEITPRWWTL